MAPSKKPERSTSGGEGDMRRLAQLPVPVGARRQPAGFPRRRRRTPRPGVGHLVHRRAARCRRDRPVVCLPDHLQQEPARRNGGRGFLHDGAVRPGYRRLRHLYRLRHAAGQPGTGSAAQAGHGRRATSTSATRAAPAPRRGPPAATATENCCPTPTASAWWARITPVGRCGWTWP